MQHSEKSNGERLREKYYDDRRKDFSPEPKRVEDRDYGVGWERYAFAAPFSNHKLSGGKSAVTTVS